MLSGRGLESGREQSCLTLPKEAGEVEQGHRIIHLRSGNARWDGVFFLVRSDIDHFGSARLVESEGPARCVAGGSG